MTSLTPPPAAIFKAYDIRGIVPTSLDEGVALGRVFALGGRP